MVDFEFQQLLEKAPKPIQDFLFTEEFSLLLKDAANLAKLDDNQAVKMGDIVANTLLGVIPVEKFKEELRKQLNIPNSSIEILDKIIQQKIIEPFKNELKQIQPLKIKTVSPSNILKTPPVTTPPLATFKTEQIKTQKESEERKKPLEQTIKPIEIKGTQTETEKEEIKLTEVKIPEAVEIQIEKPIQKEIDIQSISLPEIPPEKKEKIKTVSPSNILKTPPVTTPPLATFKTEQIKTQKESEERKKPLEQTIKPIEIKGTQTETEKEEIKLTEVKIPEAVEIQIEKPIQKEIDIQPISLPEIPPEKKEKIKEALLKTMTSRKIETPKIVEEMEKITEIPKTSQNPKQEQKQEKAVAKISQISKVVAGKNNNFPKAEAGPPKTQNKSSIFEMKIKETEEKKEELPEVKQPISYKKYRPEKPFGET
ncbi:MAG TPA: hypothetical protein PK119_00285 [Candidatus Paceibacterota bacterium]|nr:hypothetical protein [Candidatus Paceibacterota bacterium]